jgi:[ribosomal protein S5]-alanine N-acetyltransferase
MDTDIILALPNNIVVRRYHLEDAPSFSKHASSRKVWDNLRNRMPHPYSEEDARFWINLNNNPENHRASGSWTPENGAQGPLIPTNYAVVVGGDPCGSIGLVFSDPKDIYCCCAEIGYWLGESYWGRGVMSAVVPAFVEFTWRTFGVLIRLNGSVIEGNIGSLKCLQKAGFEVEGTKKWAVVKNGVVGNEVLLGALRPGAIH